MLLIFDQSSLAINKLQQELINAGVLPKDYDFEAHKELVPMQAGDVPITYADTTPCYSSLNISHYSLNNDTIFKKG